MIKTIQLASLALLVAVCLNSGLYAADGDSAPTVDGSITDSIETLTSDDTTASESFTFTQAPVVETANGTTPVPEPSSFALMGCGIVLCGLVAARRRRARK